MAASSAAAGPFPDTSPRAKPKAPDGKSTYSKKSPPIDRLGREARHTFLPASVVIHDVNHRLSLLPEWKRCQFTERYLDVDAEELEKALTIRDVEGQKQIYLKKVFDDERLVELQQALAKLRDEIRAFA